MRRGFWILPASAFTLLDKRITIHSFNTTPKKLLLLNTSRAFIDSRLIQQASSVPRATRSKHNFMKIVHLSVGAGVARPQPRPYLEQ
ncbi:hypothetical protein HI914_05372 [Erysiphe necator]|nr:hypothetical protein HI914_05372 [Erysiphe necator]